MHRKHVFRRVQSPRLGRTLLASGLLLLGSLLLLQSWYETRPTVQAQRLAAARIRWEDSSPRDYRLHYEVQQGTREPMRGMQRISVSGFFRWIENYPRTLEFRCDPQPGDCAWPVTYHVYASYDAHLGYPRSIELNRTRHPAWFNLQFWRWLVSSGEWQACENLTCTRTQHTHITIELRDDEPEP